MFIDVYCKQNFAGNSANVCEMSVKIVVFLADIDENVSQFHRIRRNFVKNIQPAAICWNSADFLEFDRPPPQKKRKDIFAGQTLVPGMSLYEFSQVSDAESQAVGDEEPMIFDS